jgi:hypothetical protein
LTSVGQFRSAGGLVLLSGGSWGLRFPPLARGINVQDEVVPKRLQAENRQNSEWLSASLAVSTDPR